MKTTVVLVALSASLLALPRQSEAAAPEEDRRLIGSIAGVLASQLAWLKVCADQYGAEYSDEARRRRLVFDQAVMDQGYRVDMASLDARIAAEYAVAPRGAEMSRDRCNGTLDFDMAGHMLRRLLPSRPASSAAER